VNGVPIQVSTTQAGSTTTSIVFSTGSNIVNYYVNNYLQLGSEYNIIISYNNTTLTATVNTPFNSAPAAGVTYYIRKDIPIFSSTLGAGSTINSLNLGSAASSTNGHYMGYYIYFTSGSNIGSTALITSYSSNTKIATVKPLLNTPSTGDAYDILQFTKDNYSPLLYWGTIGFNQPVCYSMELLYLLVPNQVLASGYGGTLAQYPYLYLKIYNEGNRASDHVMSSNNPNSPEVLFMIPLGLNLKSESFFTLKDAKCIQVVKFKPDMALRFSLTLPNGDPIIFATPDNLSPLAPNPFLQISASIAIRRLDGDLAFKDKK
jgi:hypothetical protein